MADTTHADKAPRPNVPWMNAATFKTLREILGVSSQEIATHTGIHLRTVEGWDRFIAAAPRQAPKAFSYLYRLEQLAINTLQRGPAPHHPFDPDPEEELTLHRPWQFPSDQGLSPAFQARLLGLEFLKLRSEGKHVTVEWSPGTEERHYE